MFCNAQNKKLIVAEEYFNVQRYSEALSYYIEIENKNENIAEPTQLYIQIATCYYNLHAPANAIKYYEKAINKGAQPSPETMAEYADALIETGNYTTAKEILKNSDAGLLVEAILLQKCNFALENPDANKNVNLQPLNELPAKGAYGIGLYRGNLLFITNPEFTGKPKAVFGYTGLKDQTILKINSLELPQSINSPVLDANGRYLFYSANVSNISYISTNKKNTKKLSMGIINNLFLYELSLFEEKAKPVSLPFNQIDFSCTHPCLSEDGKTLYFSSNMLGGYGGFDLYMVNKHDDGSWGKPQNLGTSVNTFLNEGYPFLSDGHLFFSSDGLPGYGGQDIFKLNLNSGEVANLGKPLNSSYDDFYYIQQSTNQGFFVSNRLQDNGTDLIFKFFIAQ